MGPRQPSSTIEVKETYYSIDIGVTYPELEPWFTAPFNLRTSIFAGRTNDESYKIYYQVLPTASHVNPLAIEAVLFLRDHTNSRTKDITDDGGWLKMVVDRYVLLSHKFPFSQRR